MRKIKRARKLAITGLILFPLLLLVLFVGLLLIAVSTLSGGSSYPNAANGVVTSIYVSDYETCSLHYTFSTEGTKFHGQSEHARDDYCDYHVGEAIEVMFDPTDPTRLNNFRISSEDISGYVPHYLIIAGAILLLELAGTIWAFVVWIRNRRAIGR